MDKNPQWYGFGTRSDKIRGQEKLRGALNILVNEHGECQVKPLVDKIRDCKREDKNQLKLFEVTP